MRYRPKRRSLERGKDKRTLDRIGGERWLELESDGKTDAPSPLLGSSLVIFSASSHLSNELVYSSIMEM